MAAAKHTRRKRGKDGSELSCAIQDRIEAERRRLQKAGAVLLALVYSLTRLLMANKPAMSLAWHWT